MADANFAQTPPRLRVPWEIIESIIEQLWRVTLSDADSIEGRREPQMSQLIGDVALIWEQDPRLKAAIPDATLIRDNSERWRLHRRISLVNKDCRALIRRLSLRFVMIEHFNDWAAYCELADPRASSHAQPSISARNEPQHLRYNASPLRWPPGHRWLTVCKQIAKLVPRCVSAQIIVTELGKDMIWIHKDWHRILRPLAELGTLKDLHIIWPSIQDARCFATFKTATEVMPFSRATSITHCRFANLPACVCPKDMKMHNPQCFVHAILSWMPNLRHLHIETPYFFKPCFYSLKLKSLTIDAPTPHADPEDSQELLAEYNLGSAIRRGLLKCPPGGAPRRLIIRTDRETLPGGWRWTHFEKFCDAFGIALEHVQVT